MSIINNINLRSISEQIKKDNIIMSHSNVNLIIMKIYKKIINKIINYNNLNKKKYNVNEIVKNKNVQKTLEDMICKIYLSE